MLIIILYLFISVTAQSNTLQVATTEYPPFQYTDNEQIKGFNTSIVEKVIKNAGYKPDIKSYPWARALKLAKKEREMLIYSIVRNPEREKKFKWIGVIAPFNVYFWKLKNRDDIKISTILDAQKFKCGATTGDVRTDQLIKLGFIPGLNLEAVESDQQNIRRLFAGKIDILTQDDVSLRYIVESLNLNFSLVQKIMYMKGLPRELYLAASLGTPDDVVEKLRASLKDLKLKK